MKDLPLGDMTFEEIISQNRLYADKTGYISRMISTKSCFLSRPRRFGKTLLIDTVEELFRGNRELFEGLEISSTGYRFEKHPVIRLNMNYALTESPERMMTNITATLRGIAASEGVCLTMPSYDLILAELVAELSNKYGSGTVILVDEYDAPVARHVDDSELAKANAQVLRGFYGAIKNSLKRIRFALVTGVTRFAMTSVDSDANNFVDLTLDPEFAGICGFPVREFDALFRDRMGETLQALKAKGQMGPDSDEDDLRRDILDWYDGYDWLGDDRILNPYSILHFFRRKSFGPYWATSGGPSHLKALMRERPLDFVQTKLDGYSSEWVTKATLDKLDPAAVLFHSGYLTIEGARLADSTPAGGGRKDLFYAFRIPNSEVENSYDGNLFAAVFDITPAEFGTAAKELLNAVIVEDSERVAGVLRGLLAGVTYMQHDGTLGFYHGLIHIAFRVSGLNVLSETAGADGRADMTLFLPNERKIVVELKHCNSRKGADDGDIGSGLEEALKDAREAIRRKGYAEVFKGWTGTVSCLALAVYGRRYVRAEFMDAETLFRADGEATAPE
jgi:hypothetical protein